MELEKYTQILKAVFKRLNADVNYTDEQIIVTINDKQFTQELTDFRRICGTMNAYQTQNCALYTPNYYERMVELDMPFRLSENLSAINDSENNIIYELSAPSIEYLYYYLDSFEPPNLRFIRELRLWNSYRYAHLLDETENIIDLLFGIMRNLITIKIKSVDKLVSDYERFFDSFRFQLAYNYDTIIKAINCFEDTLTNRKLRWRRDHSFDNLVAPKRVYNQELTNQYYMAVSSNIPFIQFVSYYHIMEYFFEKVYNDDLVYTLQEKLSNPHFSLKREKDLKEIIKLITKKVKDKDDRYAINEFEALELVLRKFILIGDIYGELNSYDSSLIDYYNTTEVSFSKGDTIDLNDAANPKLYKKIAARIYKTRNALIHSKSSEKSVYSPFKDDDTLAKEIPLVRFIAEEIILKTSKIL